MAILIRKMNQSWNFMGTEYWVDYLGARIIVCSTTPKAMDMKLDDFEMQCGCLLSIVNQQTSDNGSSTNHCLVS